MSHWRLTAGLLCDDAHADVCSARRWHIVPEHDMREHEESDACWCDPDIEEDDGHVCVIHHSADGRELYENGERAMH